MDTQSSDPWPLVPSGDGRTVQERHGKDAYLTREYGRPPTRITTPCWWLGYCYAYDAEGRLTRDATPQSAALQPIFALIEQLDRGDCDKFRGGQSKTSDAMLYCINQLARLRHGRITRERLQSVGATPAAIGAVCAKVRARLKTPPLQTLALLDQVAVLLAQLQWE